MAEFRFVVNGGEKTVDVPPAKRLSEVLREDLGLTGTKVGCGEGECGACTVILNGKTVNSCIIPVFQADGGNILTIEGVVASDRGGDIEKAFIAHGAVQCGYCIPGMVLSSYQLLEDNPRPDEEEIKKGLSGNLCRCTGYRKIIEAVKSVSDRRNGRCSE